MEVTIVILVHTDINRLDKDAGNNRTKIRSAADTLFISLKEALLATCPRFITSYTHLRLRFLSETDEIVSPGTPLFLIKCTMQESPERRVVRSIMERALQDAMCKFLKTIGIDGPVESSVEFVI